MLRSRWFRIEVTKGHYRRVIAYRTPGVACNGTSGFTGVGCSRAPAAGTGTVAEHRTFRAIQRISCIAARHRANQSARKNSELDGRAGRRPSARDIVRPFVNTTNYIKNAIDSHLGLCLRKGYVMFSAAAHTNSVLSSIHATVRCATGAVLDV